MTTKGKKMKITKSILKRIIREEILLELILMEAKVKVSYEDIESVKALYPNEQDEKALEGLWARRQEALEKNNQKETSLAKALIVWLKTNYISKKRTDHPPHEALPVVERFIGKMNSVKQKYKDNPEFKEKVNKLTKGKPPQINLFSSIDMEGLEEALEKKVGDVEGNKEQAQGDKIGETENWEVFMPTRMDSSCELGKGTTWCTARTRGDNLFYNYILDSIVLFYVIRKNAGSPKEEPDDYLSLGYREDGSKIEIYSFGQTNINSNNEGIDPEDFEAIVGEEESQEVYQIIEKRFQDFEEHPAKELLRKAGQDLNTFHSMFTKGQSPEVVLDIIKGIRRLAKESEGLSQEVKKAINDKMIKMLKNDKLKEKLKEQRFFNIDFRGADLEGVDFSERNLYNPNFEGVNLEGVNFTKTQMMDANFSRANLQGADFRFCFVYDAEFEEADLQNSNLQGALFKESSFESANLKGANFQKVNFSYCRFTKPDLRGANFERASLEGSSLRGANLKGVNLQKANLEFTNLEGANLKGANLQGARLYGALLQGAKYNSKTEFPEGFEEKFTKSKLFKMIKEEILLELLLMEAKLKVSLDDLELAEERYPEDEALAKLRKDHEDKTDRAKTKKMIFWVKTAYAGDRPQEVHPPREALPQLENFLDNLKRIKDKYKGSQPFKDKVDQITDGGKIGGDPLHPNLFNSDNFIGIMRALEGRTGEVEKDDVQAEKDKIGETANWNVYMPTTMGSSCELGKGTTWCTSRTEGNNLFYNYVARKKNIVLFYAIHKEAGPPKEDPEDYLSLGYFEDGRRVERYGYGETNIDANNDGIDPKEFELIVGKTEAEEIYSIIEKKFETMKEHPAKEMVKKAAKDLEAYNSMFPKGMGGDEALDLIRIIDEYGPLPKEIEKSRHQKLTDAVKKGAKLKDITLRNMDVRGLKAGKEIMKPANVKFINVNLEKVNFSEFEPRECFFKKVNLRESNMSMADMFSTTFEEADLGRANISKATLYKCSIRKSYFTDANMEFSDITYSSLDEVDFEGANLKDAELTHCTISKSNFSKATIDGTSFGSSSFESTKFQQTKIENVYTEETSFRACDFKGSELIGDFEDVSFSGSDFSGADLSKARFENCNLEGANFSGAILSSGDSHVDFGNSNLEGSTYNSETVYNDMMVDPEKDGMTMA